MQKSKLLELLRTFSNKELRELELMVDSPFFTTQENLIPFFQFLKNRLKNPPDKPTIFRALFPGQPYEDVRIRLLMSQLYQLAEHYLAYRQIFGQPLREPMTLAAVYAQRRLPRHFTQTDKRYTRKQEQWSRKGADDYQGQFYFYWEKSQFIISQQPTAELPLSACSDALDISFLVNKLKIACLALTRRMVYQSDYQPGFLAECLAYIQTADLLREPLIRVYYQALLALSDLDQHELFQAFKSSLFELQDHLPLADSRDLHLLAINYCIRKSNDGFDFAAELQDLYNNGLTFGFLLEGKVMSRFTFHNVVGVGLKVKAYDWVEQFIEQYQKSLKLVYRKSAVQFNVARLAYHRQDYAQALQLIRGANYPDILLNLAAKTLLLKIYFELDEDRLLEAHLDALRNFIRRKKVIGYHQKNYLNILHYTSRLLQVNPFAKREVQQLREEIEKEEVLSERAWLLAQLQR